MPKNSKVKYQEIMTLQTFSLDLKSTPINQCGAYRSIALGIKSFEKRCDVSKLPKEDIEEDDILIYPSVLHALGDAWRLLGPPIRTEDEYGADVFTWYFENLLPDREEFDRNVTQEELRGLIDDLG